MSLNYFVSNGANHIEMPTAGNIIAGRARIEFDRFYILGTETTAIGQGSTPNWEQEFRIFRVGNQLRLRWGGSQTTLFEYADVFGSSTPPVLALALQFETDGTYTVEVNSVAVVPPSNTYTRGAVRTEGMALTVGATSADSDPLTTTGQQFAGSGSEIGNIRLYLDDGVGTLDKTTSLVRNIVMPASGIAVSEIENNQNGTVITPSGSDFATPTIPTVAVTNLTELNAAIAANTATGALIQLAAGSYGNLIFDSVQQTINTPYVLVGMGDNPSDVVFDNDVSEAISFVDSSYIALYNLSPTAGLDGIESVRSHHIIIDEVEVTGQRQAGIYIHDQSRYVDVLRSHIHHTGTATSTYGEGIYIGNGGSVEEVEHVWIENNELNNTGNAEGVDIKSESFHVTVKRNNVHDISAGTDTDPHINQAAISISGRSPSTYRVGESRDIWIEENTITNVSGGSLQNTGIPTNNGIMFAGLGVNVLNNTLDNIANRAIYGNSFGDMDLPVNIFGNTVTNSGTDENINSALNDTLTRADATNPNRHQDWLETYFNRGYVTHAYDQTPNAGNDQTLIERIESVHGVTAAQIASIDLTNGITPDAETNLSFPSGVISGWYRYTLLDGTVSDEYIVSVSDLTGSPDTTAPVITLNGANPLNLTQGDNYSELGASATDNTDSSVSVIISGSADTSTVGTYTITYTATDAAGNTATATRTVNVALATDTTAPVILVSGYSDGNTINLNVGDTFTPPTATATDDVDGAITPTQSSNVNTAVAGSYTHVYTATDAASNTSTFTLNVVVSDIVISVGSGFLRDTITGSVKSLIRNLI